MTAAVIRGKIAGRGDRMTMDELIARINELSRKSRTPEGLTYVEKAERELLRKDYLARFRASMKAQLDNTVIVYPDGTRKPLRKQ